MFKEAAALGATTIRLNIALGAVFPTPNGPPDWRGTDQYMTLARRYHLRVLAVLHATPWYMVDRPDGDYHCPPKDPEQWARQAGVIAAHTRGVISYFEIVNEPDGNWAFHGTPQQYAAILTASHHAIDRASPNARVVLGGLMDTGPSGKKWIQQMLATRGADAIHHFDIANIHVRGRAQNAGPIVSSWRRYLVRKGFTGPLWVTEAGYPADPSQQADPAYRGGATAQARYVRTVIPAMLRAGASVVFITERDALTGPYATEGLLDTSDPLTDQPRYTRRQSYYAVCDFTHITPAGRQQ